MVMKKKDSPADSEVASEVDHRKRRRNRTTQSCLNCHGSKRMCDRKRPACSRCVKLGLSGVCVYEVDDLNQSEHRRDETAHLKKRIAELEDFIREFKKKATASKSSFDSGTSSPEAGPPLPLYEVGSSRISHHGLHTPPPQPNDPLSNFMASIDNSPSSTSDRDMRHWSQYTRSPTLSATSSSASHRSASPNAPAEFLESQCPRNLQSLLGREDILERVFNQILMAGNKTVIGPSSSEQCGCMESSSAYSIILELAPYVAQARQALSNMPEHSLLNSDGCNYLRRLQELERATSNIIESISSTSYSRPTRAMPGDFSTSPNVSPRSQWPTLGGTGTLMPPHSANASFQAKETFVGGHQLYVGPGDQRPSWELGDGHDRYEWPRTIAL